MKSIIFTLPTPLGTMEDRYTETHKTWNRIAQLYEEKFMDLDMYNDTYKRFCDLLSKQDASILELGCGPGNITRHILDLNTDLQVLATDVSKNMIELAKKNNPKISVQILDCRNLQTITGKFNGIICGFIIPYLSKTDLSNLIANCAISLNKDGILYLSFVEGDYDQSGFMSGSSGDRTYFYYHNLKAVEQAIVLNNMDIVDRQIVAYKKANGSIEEHTIVYAKK